MILIIIMIQDKIVIIRKQRNLPFLVVILYNREKGEKDDGKKGEITRTIRKKYKKYTN